MVLELTTRWLATAALLAALPRSAGATAMGALKLDNYTFDKVASLPGITLLTKVDKSYSYGEKEDAFKELCKLAHPVKGFLIGEVPVQEYGDKENEDLQNRFKVSTDEFPAYLLFKGSEASPTKFEGFPDPRSSKPKDWDDDEDGEWEAPVLNEPTAENLALWLRKNGVKMPAIGTIVELDEIAEKFMKEGMQDALVAEAKKVAQEQYPDDKKAPLYIKTMEKVKAKGAGYIQTELARVQKIMSGQITPEKAAELGDKVKILQVFAIS